MAADNKLLGDFELSGFPPAPRGVPQIEVSVEIDADGILHVSAKDKATNKEQRIVIQSSGGLSEDQINNMVKDAEANAAADSKRRETVEARNELESLMHSVDKNLTEHGAKLDAATKEEVDKALKEARALDSSAQLEAVKAAASALSNASMKIGQAIYGKAGAAGAGGTGDNTKEAEFTEEGKKKEEPKQ
jgi:molecular chaperone DnaK